MSVDVIDFAIDDWAFFDAVTEALQPHQTR